MIQGSIIVVQNGVSEFAFRGDGLAAGMVGTLVDSGLVNEDGQAIFFLRFEEGGAGEILLTDGDEEHPEFLTYGEHYLTY